eukprot:6927423-Prymnesium_polylepis.1
MQHAKPTLVRSSLLHISDASATQVEVPAQRTSPTACCSLKLRTLSVTSGEKRLREAVRV